MKPLYLFLFLVASITFPMLASPSPEAALSPEATEDTELSVRKAVNYVYKTWGKARVALDKETLNSIASDEFYADLYGKKIPKEQFIHDVTRKRENVRLTRFDATILTVQKKPKEWTVVISEKLELEITDPSGEKLKACSFWITRDGWRKENDEWKVTYSEAIGHEYFKPGAQPPIENW